MKKLLFYICSIHFLLFGAVAGAGAALHGQTAVDLPAGALVLKVRSGIDYFHETGPITHLQAAALPDDQWTPWPDGKIVNFDTQDHAVWLRFSVHNAAGGNASWLLEVPWAYINRIELFQYDPLHGRWSAPMVNGLDIAREQRPLDHRFYTFPLDLPPGQTTRIYIRCYANSKLLVPTDLYNPDYYDRFNNGFILMYGIFFGILFVMLCYNLSLTFFTRDKSYLYYSLYVLAIIFHFLLGSGFGPFYVWNGATWLNTNGYVVLSGLGFLAAALFIRSFLSLKRYGGWVCHINTAAIAYCCLSMLIYVLKPDPVWVKLEDLSALVFSALSMAGGIYLWTKGDISARYFTIAWSFPNIGTVIVILGVTGHIEFSGLAMFSQMIGVVLELILLSFALAERINREKASREQAQQAELALSQQISQERKEGLAAQHRLLQLQQRDNDDLERRVRERTEDLEQAMRDLEHTYIELSHKSITDALTQVHNRQYFNQILDTEIRRAIRFGHPLSLLMVDLDHFKSVNDVHGHLVGDQCLRRVAQTIRQNVIRASDLVARYGGEEFAMILPATTPSDAQIVAGRIRKAVEELQVETQGKQIRLSVSIGIAGWIPLSGSSAEQLIQFADEALYAAKSKGRNRIETSVVVGESVEKSTDRQMGAACL